MLNIVNHQRNANQNHNDLTYLRRVIIQKNTNNVLMRIQRKWNHYTLLVGFKLRQPLWKTVWRFLKKLKIELPYDPATPLLGICSKKKTKMLTWKDTCIPMFVVALFTIEKIWKQPIHSTDEWIKKMNLIHTHIPHTQWNTTLLWKILSFCLLQQSR